jgi:hypothetical protein
METAKLKNYTSSLPVESSISIIQRALIQHKVRRIVFEQDGEGSTTALSFEMVVSGKRLAFRLPVRFDGVRPLVEQAFRDSHQKRPTGPALDAQTQRTAWANVKDWVLAQMALIDAAQVKVEEVFFPYLLDESDRTVFEAFEARLSLPAPKHSGRISAIEEVR